MSVSTAMAGMAKPLESMGLVLTCDWLNVALSAEIFRAIHNTLSSGRTLFYLIGSPWLDR